MILMIIAALCAFFVKGLCGFAHTIVFSTILSFSQPNSFITPLELLTGYPGNIILAWKERKFIDNKIWIPLSVMVIIGAVPGIFLLASLNAQTVKIIFGFVIILIGIELFFRERTKKKKKQNKIIFWIISIISGLLCGLYGIGALVAAYVSRVTDDSKALKANISLVFLVENTFRAVLYAITGIITLDILKSALILLPFMVTGLLAGIKCSSYIDESKIKIIINITLIFSGMFLVISNISQML